MAMTRGIIRMTDGGRVSMPHLYLTYKLPSRITKEERRII